MPNPFFIHINSSISSNSVEHKYTVSMSKTVQKKHFYMHFIFAYVEINERDYQNPLPFGKETITRPSHSLSLTYSKITEGLSG